MLLKIVQSGDPVLRQGAQPLTREQVRSDGVQFLIALMRETMRDAPGVGLAAPQIGEPLQLIVIEDAPHLLEALTPEERRERDRSAVPFHVLVNPALAVTDPTPVEFFEGCLSIAGYTALVPRARAVHVDALDHNGDPVSIDAHGWYARILQHETDHLAGNLYIDRMDPRTFSTREHFGRIWAGLKADEVRERVARVVTTPEPRK